MHSFKWPDELKEISPLKSWLEDAHEIRLRIHNETASTEPEHIVVPIRGVQDGEPIPAPTGKFRLAVIHIYGSRGSTEVHQTYGVERDAEILEIHFGLKSQEGFVANNHTHVKMEANARAEFGQVFYGGPGATMVNELQADLSKDSNLNVFNLALSSSSIRNEIETRLLEEGALIGLFSLGRARKDQKVENRTFIHHVKGHTVSHQEMSNILLETGQSEFTGRLLIAENAQKSEASQMNHNLMLSPDTQAITRPQLEVQADDVKASHGATVGQIQEHEVFYLMSRGLSRELSVRMIARGFERSVLSNVKSSFIRANLENYIELAGGVEL